MDPTAALPSLLKAIEEKGAIVTQNSRDEKTQGELLAAARALVTALESPIERVCRMCYLEPTLWAVVRVAIDIDLYPALMADNGSPKTADQLAKECKVNSRLMSRFCKHLAAGDVIKEVDKDTYIPNGITALMSLPNCQGMHINTHDIGFVSAKFPQFLKERNYQNPINRNDSPFMYAAPTDMHYFTWLAQPGMEEQYKAFERHMAFKDMGKKWYDPSNVNVQEIFDNPTDPEATLMVDIGGSIGHDIIGFRKAYPNLPGRLVLQDLPATIGKLDMTTFPKDIKAMPHDFFTPEPVHGAKAFYLHMVLHDWPDEACEKILSNIVPAMKMGYSKILLNECVIPDRNANWYGTSLDILMMLTHASMERTETDWKNLLGRVGLRITKIWDCSGNPEKIIEAKLV